MSNTGKFHYVEPRYLFSVSRKRVPFYIFFRSYVNIDVKVNVGRCKVLLPILSATFIWRLSSLLHTHNITEYFYADNTQIYDDDLNICAFVVYKNI